jgi:hypothetical protein
MKINFVRRWVAGAGACLALFTLASISAAAEKLSGQYHWTSENDAKLYKDATWEKIKAPRFSSFPPPAEEKVSDCLINVMKGDYLRREGGSCVTGVWLEIGNGASRMKIDTLEKLKKQMGPIDSEAKAVDLVSLTQGNLRVPKGGEVPEGRALKTERGYLIQL